MSRFARHLRRRVTSLDGLWDFSFDGGPPDVMAVPGCWDATPRYAGRRGVGVYRREVVLADGTPHRLVFDGVQHFCRVLLDGELLAEHGGGFTRFTVDVPRSGTLEVHVDNRDGASPLHRDFFDWYHYGGIARPVTLHRLGTSWIESVRCTTTAHAPVPAVRLDLDLRGAAAPLRVTFGDEVVWEEPSASGTVTREVELPGRALWHLDDPVLHVLDVRFGEDDHRERIGLRTVEAAEREIRVNGRAVRLLGVCRHDMHPDHGAGLPADHRLADLQLIEDLGATFVRGGHYPADETFLDLCDERGIAFWSEATAWQPDSRQLTDEAWLAAAERNIDEMVAHAHNHPSVLMWGLLNEGTSQDEACRPGYERLIARIRRADGSRPVTYAGNHTADDRCSDLVDVVSINAYPGWYYGATEDVAPELDRLVAAVDAVAPDKPVVISEIGAEGIPGWRDRAAERWSEEHQAHLLDVAIRHLFGARDRVCGLTIWVFADFKVPLSMPRILARPRGYNHKGIVTDYRQPKLATEAVARAYRELRG